MAISLSPNMTLPIPGVGNEAGPNYAFDVNASLTLIDQHDHSPGRGVKITPAGININTDLTFNNVNSIVSLKSLIMVEQTSLATTQTLYVAPGGENTPVGDLFYNDSAGNVIQITKGGIVNTVASSIPGESYVAGTFIWTQTQSAAPTTPANFDIGSITIRPNTPATTNGVTLSPPSSIASAYTLFLPPDPSAIPSGAGRFLTIQNTGVISETIPVTAGITGTNIAAQTVTGSYPGGPGTGNIADGTIGDSNLAVGIRTVQVVQNFGVGTHNFTIPAGVFFIEALLAPGGGGGGGGGAAIGGGAGGAGGGGSLPIYSSLAVTPGDNLLITVGAGGAGGASETNGTAGANSQILDTTTSTQLMDVEGGFAGNRANGTSPGTGQVSTFNGQGFHIGGSNGGNTGASGAAGQSTFFGTGGGGGAASGGGGGGGGAGAYIGQGGTGGSGAGGSPGVNGGNANSPGGGGGGGGGGTSGGTGGTGQDGLCRLIYAQVV